MSYVRSAVSKDKIRFRDGQYDLDLTYIRDNVIAMGFPASGVESAYRNDIGHVAEMLNARHFMHYMIWNLSQRPYDYGLFHDMIQPLGWPDHHAPALSLLFKIVSGMDSWLKADKKNIAVVHCMAGKGRTGTVICSYLLYCGEFDDPLKAIRFFGRKRSAIEAGVEQPSQQRYVSYFSDVLNGFVPRPQTRRLKRLVLRPVPSFSHLSGIRPVLHIFNTTQYPETLIYTNAPVPDIDIRHYAPYEGKVDFLFRVPIKLKGDILIRLYHLSSRFGGSMTATVPVLRAQFHTAFVDGEVLVFTKEELDLAYKDKRFNHAFEMKLYFEPDVEDDDEVDETWTPEAHQNFMAVAKRNRERKNEEATRNPSGGLVHKNNMQYREEQFLENEAKLGREWHTIGDGDEEEEDDDEEAAAAAESSDDVGEARDNGFDGDDDFSILSVVEGKNPRVTERKLDLDLSSAKSKRNSELVIGTRDSPRYRPDAAQQAEAADEEAAAAGQRRRSQSEERTTTTSSLSSSSSSLSSSSSSTSTNSTTKPTTPRETALTDPLQRPGLRKSTSALGNHRSSIAPAAAAAAPATTGDNSRFGGGRSGSDDTSYSDSGVEEALEDLLKVTEELKNSVLLRDDDDDDDDSGADVSWRDNNNSGSDSESEAATGATGDRQRGGVMIASARGRQQPTSPPASQSQQNGTFGSLQEDLSDFEFLYTQDDRTRYGSSSSSSASTTPSKSQHRFPKPSSLKKYFLE